MPSDLNTIPQRPEDLDASSGVFWGLLGSFPLVLLVSWMLVDAQKPGQSVLAVPAAALLFGLGAAAGGISHGAWRLLQRIPKLFRRRVWREMGKLLLLGVAFSVVTLSCGLLGWYSTPTPLDFESLAAFGFLLILWPVLAGLVGFGYGLEKANEEAHRHFNRASSTVQTHPGLKPTQDLRLKVAQSPELIQNDARKQFAEAPPHWENLDDRSSE
jgi:hypothetical protein